MTREPRITREPPGTDVGRGQPIAVELADFVASAATIKLDPAISRRIQAFLLDTLAVTVAAVDEPSSRAIVRAVATGAGDETTIVGAGLRARAEIAALVNGTFAHTLELDDDHRLGTVHPGAVVVPAAVAACESAGAGGERLLQAILLGYEIMCRAGEAFMGRQFYRGFHPTGTCGVFGAAVAAAVAFDLSRDQVVHALGIAGTQAAGLGEWRRDGSWIKRLHPGRAAQSGVLAARLAGQGFTGPATIFEGPDGFLQAFAYEDYIDAGALLRGLGTDYRALLTAFKPYPGCRFAHAGVDLAVALRMVEGIDPNEIVHLQIRLFRTDILNYDRRPRSLVMAQFSVPYLVGAALNSGRLGLDDFSETAIRRPEVLSIADRIEVIEDDSLTSQYPARYPTELVVTMRDGRTVRKFSDCPLGDPQAPAYAGDSGRFEREVTEKARDLLHGLGRSQIYDRLATAIWTLPNAPDVSELTGVLSDVPQIAP